jgi:putative intracellular protease/amidase
MKTAFVLYPDFTALDLVGPYEVISRWPGAEVHFLARSLKPMRCDEGPTVIPTDTPATLPDPDLIVVPGSGKPIPVMSDQVLIDWLRTAAPNCRWTASVCTGAGLYAAAELLEGKTTTTHWAFRDNLRAMGVEVVADRVVWQGNHISGAGVSAGIDMALSLTDGVHGREVAEALQLTIEYDPEPPFQSGSPSKADASTLRVAFRLLLGDSPVQAFTQMQGHAVAVRLPERARYPADARLTRVRDCARAGRRGHGYHSRRQPNRCLHAGLGPARRFPFPAEHVP